MTQQLQNFIEDIDLDIWNFDAPDAEVPQTHPLMEKLVADTHSAALMTAAVTSVINAFKEAAAHEPSQLRQYVPTPGGMILGLEMLAREAHLSVEADAAVRAFFSHLEPCLLEMESYFADAHTMGIGRANALHRYSLASSWRLVCLSAGDAVEALASETEDRLPDLYNLSAGILNRLLDAAARGQSPCLNADGKPYLPALPQRRQGARRVLHQPATLNCGGDVIRVFVRDVSQGGLGLERVRRVKDGDLVTVTLQTGRTFTGTVVWRKGARAGVRLADQLAPNDPLLWA